MTKSHRLKRYLTSSLMTITIALVLALIASIVPVATVSADGENSSVEIAPLNPDFVDYINNPPDNSYGYIPPPMDLSHVSRITQKTTIDANSIFNVNPGLAYFDWRDSGKVTSVKDQSTCGTCWAFGIMSAVESRVLIMENVSYDFSEQNLVCCTDSSLVYLHADRCDAGGWSAEAADTLIKKGTRLESCQPYNTNTINTQACNNNCQSIKMLNGYRLVTNDGSQISTIKDAIYNYGPVSMSFYMDNYPYPHLYSGNIYYYPNCTHSPNHLVSIVGWNDSIPHPAGGGYGAWIVKNSWGTSWGDGGYFYLCYGSANMTEVASYRYKDYNSDEKLYYWDEAGWCTDLGAGVNHSWMANVFTSTQNGYITNVDFWTTSNNAQYQIYIYNGSFGSTITSQTGSCAELGYYSIPLNTTVWRSNGQQFTVAVRMTTPGYNWPIPVEYVSSGKFEPAIQSGVSFDRIADSGAWTDLASVAGGCNACLRARIITAPAAPVLTSPANGATGMNQTPRLAWNPSTGAVNYSVQVSTVSNFSTTVIDQVGVTDSFFDVSLGVLAWNTRYYWRVNAVSDYGASAWSISRYFTTGLGPPPADPSDLTATAVSSVQINLAWADNSDNETGFKIERKAGASGTYAQIGTVGANVTAYSSTGLTTNTTYYYQVRAYSAAGNSNYSDPVNATTLPLPPSVPVLKSPASGATGMNQTPRLAWNPSTGALNYSIQLSNVSTFATTLVNEVGVTNIWFDVSVTLEWNKTYYWRVNAVEPSGSMSAWTAARSFKTATVPPPADPSDLTATVVSSSRIDLTWTDNSNNETGFKIERKTGAGGTYAQIGIVGANVSAYSNTALTANTTYYYRVRSYNAGWNSNYSDPVNATTLPLPPAAPVLKTPASGATGMNQTPRLAWNPSTGAVNYSILVSTLSTFATTVINQSGVTVNYSDVAGGTLAWNTRYYWRVNAVGVSGSTSAWSTSRYFTTGLGPPPADPSNLAATTISSSQINLVWQDNSNNETGFKIERKAGAGGTYAQIGTVGANVSAYSNTGLTANTTYYYQVRSYSAAGNSNYSDPANATTFPLPPSAPVLKTPASGATGMNQTPRLAWNPSTGAVNYSIQVSTLSTFATTVVNQSGVTVNYSDVAGGMLAWNTRYYWRVNAVGPSGSTSAWSAIRYFKTNTSAP